MQASTTFSTRSSCSSAKILKAKRKAASMPETDWQPRSAVLISRLKNIVGYFVGREKYCSGWKNKLKSTDYKPDEQGLNIILDKFFRTDMSDLLPVWITGRLAALHE
jgi:hypothetical protein